MRGFAQDAPAEPSSTPRFSVRFADRHAALTLSAPLLFEGGRILHLEMVVDRAARVTDFARGWRVFALRRSRLVRLELELEPRWLTLDGARLVGSARGALLFELERPWGHVALELRPVLERPLDGPPELALVPEDARAVHAGPRPPLAEVVELGRGERVRFDPARGALIVGDVLLTALTDALVEHGLRVPERDLAPEDVWVRGGKLVFVVGGAERASSGERDAPSLAEARERGRKLGPLLLAAATGEPLDARAVSTLPPSLARALGANAHDGPLGRLALAIAGECSAEEIARAAREVDEAEPCPGVATDALLRALEHVGDPAVARELALRAFARSPAQPRVVGSALELAAARTDLSVVAEILDAAALVQPGDPHLSVALARLEEHRGDHEAAFARWRRAVEHADAPPEAHEGLARMCVRRGRLDEALIAMDRAAEAYRAVGRARAQLRAELAAARILFSGREAARCLERLSGLASRAPAALLEELVVERIVLAARAHRLLGDEAHAALVETDLLRHVEERGAAASDEAVRALFDAGQAALMAGAGARGDAIAATLARIRPGEPWVAELRQAELAATLARLESVSPADRAQEARHTADTLAARGRTEDAAAVLFRAGELDRDLTLLRAAIDRCERAGLRLAARDLIDRTLAIVGDGPARAQLEARRAALA